MSEEPEVLNDEEIEAAVQQDDQAKAKEREDWKTRAIQAEERAKLLEELRQPQPQPPTAKEPSEAERIQEELADLVRERAKFAKDTQEYWDMGERINDMRSRISEARIQEAQTQARVSTNRLVVAEFEREMEGDDDWTLAKERFQQAKNQPDFQQALRGDGANLKRTLEAYVADLARQERKAGRSAKAPPKFEGASKKPAPKEEEVEIDEDQATLNDRLGVTPDAFKRMFKSGESHRVNDDGSMTVTLRGAKRRQRMYE